MKPSFHISVMAALAAGLTLLGASSTAVARDRSEVNWSISIGTPPAVYGPPPVVYSYPQPVYVQPPPVYVQPGPGIVYSAPGYIISDQTTYYYGQATQPRHYRHYDRHRHGDGRGYGRGHDHGYDRGPHRHD